MVWRQGQGQFQQGNYLEYAASLDQGNLSLLDPGTARLSPGLPSLIYFSAPFLGGFTGAGQIIVILSYLFTYYIVYRYTQSKYAFLALVFPPVVFSQFTLINSDPVFIAVVLLALLLLAKEKWFLPALLMGLSVWFRLLGLIFAPVLFIWYAYRGEWVKLSFSLLIFALPIIALVAFNAYHFGPGYLLQQAYPYVDWSLTQASFLELWRQIPEAYDLNRQPPLLSGLLYLGLFFAWWLLATFNTDSLAGQYRRAIGLTATFMILLVFTLGPTPFLEEFARYLVPVFVLLWLQTYRYFSRPWLAWTLLLFSIGALTVM